MTKSKHKHLMIKIQMEATIKLTQLLTVPRLVSRLLNQETMKTAQTQLRISIETRIRQTRVNWTMVVKQAK